MALGKSLVKQEFLVQMGKLHLPVMYAKSHEDTPGVTISESDSSTTSRTAVDCCDRVLVSEEVATDDTELDDAEVDDLFSIWGRKCILGYL